MSDEDRQPSLSYEAFDGDGESIDETAFEFEQASQWAFPIKFEQPHEVIRASAGSGKTYQLSNRYLGLLRNQVEAEQILATTFTRKAAGEILERILTRIAKAASNDAAAKELASGLADTSLDRSVALDMLTRLCHALHRVAVSTIDSFFNRVAQVFRYELRLPPEPTLAGQDDPAVMQLRARAIEAMLGDDDATTMVQLLRRLHHDQTKRSVTAAIDEIVSALYETYRMSDAAAWQQLQTGELLESDALEKAIDALVSLSEKQTKKSFKKALAESSHFLARADWQGFLSKGPAAKIVENPDAPMFYSKSLPDDIDALYRPLVAHAGGAMIASVKERTLAMHDLMERFDSHFTKLREEHHVLLYADMPHRLLQYMEQSALAGSEWNSDLHYRLDTRVSHLLLDEFQDTSFEQWAVLKPFADEITAMGDQSRSFFCVGDVKQAIYGWRGGRAEIFDRLRDDLMLDDAAIRRLNDNYRSSQVVLDTVNQLFGTLNENGRLRDGDLYEHEANLWQPLFANHHAIKADPAKKDSPGYVELVTTTAATEDDEDALFGEGSQDGTSSGRDDDDGEQGFSASSHLDAVADRVKQLHEENPHASLGVLVSTNKTVHNLLYLLGSRGVPVSGEGGVTIVGDPAINLIMAALQLAEHPGDQVAAFALFNSPMRDALSLRSQHETDRDASALRIREAIQSDGYAATLSGWAEALAAHSDERSAGRLSQLVELADRFDPGVSLRIGEFIDFVEGATVEEPSAANVRVMTIHKAKGLEFDIVVLPELSKELGRINMQAVLVNQDDAEGVVREVHAFASSAIRAMSPQLTEAYEQEKARRIREGLCVLYVAMTRARHALYMMVEPLTRKKGGDFSKRGFEDHSFAAILRAGLKQADVDETDAGGQTLYMHGDPAWASHIKVGSPPNIERLVLPRFASSHAGAKASMQQKRNLPTTSPSSMNGASTQESGQRSAADLFKGRTGLAQLRGSLIHHWFEQIEWLEADGDIGGNIDSEICVESGSDSFVEHWLNAGRQIVPPAVAGDDWIGEQYQQFQRMLKQPVVRDALTRPSLATGEAIALWRERRFTVKLEDRLLNGAFDRVVVHKKGDAITRVTLIDFKTDAVADDASLAAAVASYRLQMNAYADALCRLLEVDASIIDASLLFVGAGERVGMETNA